MVSRGSSGKGAATAVLMSETVNSSGEVQIEPLQLCCRLKMPQFRSLLVPWSPEAILHHQALPHGSSFSS